MKLEDILDQQFLKRMEVVDYGVFIESRPTSYAHFQKWSQKNSELNYLTDERGEKRQDLKLLYPYFESGISFLFSYAPTKKFLNQQDFHHISSYALHFDEKDYHFVLAERLKLIGEKLKSNYPSLNYELCLDTKPVLERDFAYQAGLGWFGKNSMLINRNYGSYFLIGTLLFNQKVAKDEGKKIETDHCGQCAACVEACPTQAIDGEKRTLSLKDCLSYYTIEVFKENTQAPQVNDHYQNEVFGCEICQEVCPWNKKPLDRVLAKVATGKIYQLFSESFSKVLDKVSSLSNSQYKKFFFGSSFYRSGKRGLLKNLKKLPVVFLQK